MTKHLHAETRSGAWARRKLFLSQIIKNPRAVGAVSSSGPHLAKRMVEELGAVSGPVVELGPGTGAFTRAMVQSGISESQLVLVENNEDFARHLRQDFAKAKVVHGDACQLSSILESQGHGKVQHMVSSLPFRSFNKALREALIAAIGEALAPGGVVVQFTYSLQPPMDPEAAQAAKLHGTRKGFVAANLPPAFVWRYVKLG